MIDNWRGQYKNYDVSPYLKTHDKYKSNCCTKRIKNILNTVIPRYPSIIVKNIFLQYSCNIGKTISHIFLLV
jgi:hypothetical protein